MGHNEPVRKSTHGSGASASEIPDKLYFRIGEVARLCEVPAYVLRFWEGKFPQLQPNKGGTGQRLYRRRDVEMALRIKRLLYDEGYTIPGARQIVHGELKQKDPQLPLLAADLSDPRRLVALRRELEAIAAMLARPCGKSAGVKAVHPIRGRSRVESQASGAATSHGRARSSGGPQTDDIPFETAPAREPGQG